MGSVEDILRMAAARQEAAKKQIDQKTIDKIEQGALRHQDLRGQDADLTEAVQGMEASLKAVQASLDRLAIQAQEVESNQALQTNSDLLQQAQNIILEDQNRLGSERKQLLERIERVNEQIQTARQAPKDLSEGIRPHLSEREVPQQKPDKIWRFVESERGFEAQKADYENHALREAEERAEEIVRNPSVLKQEVAFDPKGHYLWGIPTQIFSDPRIRNAYIRKFQEVMRRIIKEQALKDTWRNPDAKPNQLTNEQAGQIQQGQISFIYKGDTVMLWDKGDEVRLLDEPNPEINAELTENEQQIVREAIQNKWSTKEELLAKLKFSEYSEAADTYFRTAASEEDAEYVQQKFSEKLPELETEAKGIREEKALKQTERGSATKLLGLVKDYIKVQKEIPSVMDRVANLKSYLERLQAGLKELNEKLSGQPRKLKIFGGGVKDKNAEAKLQKDVEEKTAEISRVLNEKVQEEQKLDSLQQDVLSLQVEIRKIDAKGFNEKGDLTISQWDATLRAEKSERDLRELDERVLRLDKTRELWSQGKFMDFSVAEMRFISPDNRGVREVDYLADRICNSIKNFYDVYSRWEQLPETMCKISNGRLALVGIGTARKEQHDYDFTDLPQEFRSAYGPNLARVLSETLRRKLVENLKLRPQQAPKITITLE